jgi:hypothetical protein
MHSFHTVCRPDVAPFLLDLTHGLEIGGSVEGVASHEEKLDEITRDISTSNIESTSKVGESETIIHRDDMCDTVSGINNNTGGET